MSGSPHLPLVINTWPFSNATAKGKIVPLFHCTAVNWPNEASVTRGILWFKWPFLSCPHFSLVSHNQQRLFIGCCGKGMHSLWRRTMWWNRRLWRQVWGLNHSKILLLDVHSTLTRHRFRFMLLLSTSYIIKWFILHEHHFNYQSRWKWRNNIRCNHYGWVCSKFIPKTLLFHINTLILCCIHHF